MPSSFPVIALLVAAGESHRMGEGLPKQYRNLHGKTVLRRTVEAFLRHPLVNGVCVVIHPHYAAEYAASVKGLSLLPPVHGGSTRQESVRNGLMELQKYTPQKLLVHDAARCFVDAETVSRVIHALEVSNAAIPAIAVSDTLKRIENSMVQATIDRNSLFQAQTPQGFEFSTLCNLHLNEQTANNTDDAALAEAAGIAVAYVEGNPDNFKITTPQDWNRAEKMTQSHYEYRTGMGYDVHRFVDFAEGAPRHVHLCGLEVPHSHRLEGHSDADVGLHALVDAILGALALGDIGLHFPPSDPRWKGADSSAFIHYCVEKMAERGALFVHADITFVCEAPKIGPHRAAMQSRVAQLLGVTPDRISIKATTTETLGFTGRREGMAAQAVATLKIPQPVE